jgi:hypothetical protein
MIQQEETSSRRVPARTIVAAIAMLIGIVLMGLGYFRNEHLLLYAGLVITLGGVMTDAIPRVVGGLSGQR